MNGRHLFLLCKQKITEKKPKSIMIKYGPIYEESIGAIISEFKEASIGSILEGVEIKLKQKRSGGLCNSCGYKRNFLHLWELCPNCSTPAICVDFNPIKQIEIAEIEFFDGSQGFPAPSIKS